MSNRFRTLRVLITAALALSVAAPALAVEQPVAPEHNPPGDIPDSQVFIAYAGPGMSMQVPEGWSRTDIAGGARFADKYNRIEITSSDAAAAPTLESVKAGEAASLAATGHAVAIADIKAVKLDGGPAIRIDYQSNSEPNDVTGKQIRLERVRYLYFRNGRQISLDMAAPAGADNVDQWRLMANSVKFN
jgi:hypothetical protein